MSTTGEQIVHGRYCNRYGVFCTGANEGGECNATACWNSTARTVIEAKTIEREDAKKWLTNLRVDCGRYQDLWPYAEALEQIIESLDADAVPIRHGRWVKVYGDHLSMGHRPWTLACSECDRLGDGTPYCPNCGAKMVVE